MNTQALEKIIQAMTQDQVDQLLISDPIAIDYLIGYLTHPGERLLLLTLDQSGQMHLFLNRLFPALESDIDSLQVHDYIDGQAVIPDLLAPLVKKRIGIDKNWPSHFLVDLLKARPELELVVGSPYIDRLRALKSPQEIETMVKASALNDQAMGQIIDLLSARLTQGDEATRELDLVDELDRIYLELGNSGFSFDPIIAYGEHAADPHHEPGQGKPLYGKNVLFDIGAVYQGLCSDMTRTVFYGEVSDRDREIYNLVLEANLKAIAQVKPGVTFASIDQAARSVIEAGGYGQYFTHRLGHSIGREVHEYGDVSGANQELVQVGQIFSIEPGIYLPGDMGVRIEDLVLVTEDGCQVLNQYPKDLIIIPREAKMVEQ